MAGGLCQRHIGIMVNLRWIRVFYPRMWEEFPSKETRGSACLWNLEYSV